VRIWDLATGREIRSFLAASGRLDASRTVTAPEAGAFTTLRRSLSPSLARFTGTSTDPGVLPFQLTR